MATRRVIAFRLGEEDIRLLREVIGTELDLGIKTGAREKRVHLYRLRRRLARAQARLDLER